MAQSSKRSLRERRAPKSFDSDNEEQDPWGYSKPSYCKEPRNPSQQLNSEAKLLVKFLSAINKNYREYETEHRKKEPETIKEPLPLRDRKNKTTQPHLELQKRTLEGAKEGRVESTRKQKQTNNFKAQSSNDAQALPTPQFLLNKFKALNTESANKMLNIEYGLSKNKPTPQDSTRPKPEKLQVGNEAGNNFKKAQFQVNPRQQPRNAASQKIFYNSSKQRQQRRQEVETALNIPKSTISENKIFKRSAYHVAIAYHIYVLQLKEKGGVELDPTAKARKLKQGMNR